MHCYQNQDAAPRHDPEQRKTPDAEHNMGYDSISIKVKNRQNGTMLRRVVHTGDPTSKARNGKRKS